MTVHLWRKINVIFIAVYDIFLRYSSINFHVCVCVCVFFLYVQTY